MVELVGLRVRVAPQARAVEAPPRDRRPPARHAVLVHLHADGTERLQSAVAIELLDGLPIAATIALGEASSDDELVSAKSWARVRSVPSGPGLVVVPSIVSHPQLGRLIARRGGSRGASLTGFALPWLLGRLAGDCRRARSGSGLSLALVGCGLRREDGSWADSHYQPRLRVTKRPGEDAGAFVTWIPSRHLPKKGRLAAGAFVDLALLGAALGADASTPAHLAASFGLCWPEEADHPLNQLLDEALVLADLSRRLLAELAEVAPGLAPQACWSAGSIATHLLRLAAVRPSAETTASLSPEVRGAAAGAFHGGRVEALLVGTATQLALFDLAATYAALFSLLDLTHHLSAAGYHAVEVTGELCVLLARPDLGELLFDRRTWAFLGPIFALVEPHGERLPSMRESGARWRGVVAPLELHGGVLPFHACDLLGPALDGRVPTVVRAFRVEPKKTAEGRHALQLPSGQLVDLRTGDLGRALVAERERAELIRDPLQRARRRGLSKALAVSLAYGVFARVDRREQGHAVEVEAIGPAGELLRTKTTCPELAGPFTLFSLGSAIPAACRAIVDLACRDVAALGDVVAAVMTDAIAVATGEPRRVARAIARYDGLLHPDGSTTAWKAECDSVEHPTVGLLAGVNKLLLGRDEHGQFRLVRSSDTALGEHLLDPTGTRARLSDGRSAWSAELEEHLLASCVASADSRARLPHDLPGWASQPALKEERAATITELRRLRRQLGDNTVMGFCRYVSAESGGVNRPVCLGADRDPATWQSWSWRLEGQPCRIAVVAEDGQFVASAGSGNIVVCRSVRDCFRSWLNEVDPTVSGPARGRRNVVPIESHPALVELVGRSGERAGELSSDDPLTYGTGAQRVLLEDVRRLGSVAIATRTGLAPRTARRIAAGAITVLPSTARSLVDAVTSGQPERRCAVCGTPIAKRARRDARFCSATCRQREHRSRRALPTAEVK